MDSHELNNMLGALASNCPNLKKYARHGATSTC